MKGNRERISDFPQANGCRIQDAPFNPTNVGSVKIALGCQLFLRNPCFIAASRNCHTDGLLFETDVAYLCEKSQADKRPCKFKINKVILQQPVDRDQAAKLLETNRTDLLTNFISKAGRPFPAHLVMDDSGKITFDFPPREQQPAKE